MNSLAGLVWRQMAAYRLRTFLTGLAVTLSVAMVLAAAIVGQAAGKNVSTLAAEEDPVDLILSARQGASFDGAILDQAAGVIEVEAVSPSLHLTARSSNPPIPLLNLWGIEPAVFRQLHPLDLDGPAFLDGPDTIALPADMLDRYNLQPGDSLVVQAGANSRQLMISGRLRQSDDSLAAAEKGVAYVPLAIAQELAGLPDQVDRVEIRLVERVDVAAAQDTLTAALDNPEILVQPGAGDSLLGNVIFIQSALVLVGFILLFVAGFVILNAFGMSITGRLQELGVLRAVGMTRRQIRQIVWLEAGFLAILGTLTGLLIGLLLGWLVFALMGNLADQPFEVPGWGVGLGVVLGLTMTMLAAGQPAWRAGRVSPILATRPQILVASGWYVRRGGYLGLALLVGTAGLILYFGFINRPTIFVALGILILVLNLLLLATIFLLPVLIELLAKRVQPLLARMLKVPGRLAIDNLLRNRLRTVLTAAALIAGLTMIVSTSGFMAVGLKGSFGSLDRLIQEDVYITGDVAAFIESGELTFENFLQVIGEDRQLYDLEGAMAALQPLVDEGLITIERNRFVPVPAEVSGIPGAPANFVDLDLFLPIGSFTFAEGDADSALALAAEGPVVLLQPLVAERLGVGLGDIVAVDTPAGGLVDFTVAGLGGSGWNMTIFNYADGERYFNVTAPSHIAVIVAEGEDVDEVLVQVGEIIDTRPDVILNDYDNNFEPLLAAVDRVTWLVNGLLLVAVLVAALGVVNTMIINVTERQRELGLLRAVGAAAAQVRWTVAIEAAVLGLFAALVAAVLGLLLLLSYGVLALPNAMNAFGVPMTAADAWFVLEAGLRDWGMAALLALVIAPLVAALAAYYPARLATAVSIVTATRGE